MIRRNIVYCISLLVSIHVAAQLDKEYFEKLRKEKVESSDALVWKQFGPGMSGYCEEFWCHPTDAGVMFMGPDMHVSYGTWDDGHSWHTLKDCDGTGQDMKRVIEMDFSRQNPDFGLALDWNGEVYETRDRGHRWECIYKLGKRHSALAVDPNDDSVWYVGAGDFWNVKANHRSLEHLHGIQLPFTAYGCVWKSTDKGRTWKKYSNGLPEKMDIGKIIVDPRNSSVIYLVGGHGIYKSKDGGKTWKNRSVAVPYDNKNLSGAHLYQYSLTVDYQNPERVYFCVMRTSVTEVGEGKKTKDFDAYGVYASSNGGKTWALSNEGLPDKCSVNRITMDPHRPEVLYAALNKSGKVNGGLYRTDNHGEEWQQMDIPDIITSVNHVFVDKNTGYIYISCGTKTGTAREGGVWRSKNKGKTWQKIFEMPYVWQAETSPVDSDIIIVSSAGCPGFNERQPILNPGAYLSKDSGRHWTKVNKNLGQPDKIVDIKPDIHDRNVFWCALWGSGWYKGVLTE